MGRRAAWIGTALLATDPIFIVTESIDFGFVALQHAFKLGALVLLVAYHHRPSAFKLAGASFLFGLAMWDKAVFAWILASIVLAGAAVFWREVLQHLTVHNAVVAGAAFLLGALPFVIYNVARPLETLTQNAHLMPDNPRIKLILLKRTIDGSGLFGYVTASRCRAAARDAARRNAARRVCFERMVSRANHRTGRCTHLSRH